MFHRMAAKKNPAIEGRAERVATPSEFVLRLVNLAMHLVHVMGQLGRKRWRLALGPLPLIPRRFGFDGIVLAACPDQLPCRNPSGRIEPIMDLLVQLKKTAPIPTE